MTRYPALAKGFPSGGVRSEYTADTEAEMPAPSTAKAGDRCFTTDTGKLWNHTGLAWAESVGGGSGDTFIKLVQSANVSTGANVTPIDCPGLVFSFVAGGVYAIDLYMLTQAPAATTGHGFQVDVSVAVTLNAVTFYHQLANAGTLTGGSAIADDASVGVSSGQPTLNVPVLNHGAGMLFAGATPGTAQLRFRSETTAVATCLGGSIMRVLRVA